MLNLNQTLSPRSGAGFPCLVSHGLRRGLLSFALRAGRSAAGV